MNNNRLSTSINKNNVDRGLLYSKIESILLKPSNYEYRDGGKFIISRQKYQSGGGKGVAIITREGLILKSLPKIKHCPPPPFGELGKSTVTVRT